MKLAVLPLVLILLVSYSSGAEEVQKPPLAFVTLQEKYNNAVIPIDLERNERKVALTQSYMTALEELQQNYMADGDLDGSVAAKEEKERMGACESATAAGIEAMPERIRNMRRDYEEKLEKIDQEQDRELENVRERYVQNLSKLERRLTRQGDLDGALIVRGEKERMSRDSDIEDEEEVGYDPWTREWELVTCWAPGNKTHNDFEESWHEGDMPPGEYDNRPFCEGAGVRTGILELHPVSPRDPARIRYKGKLNRSTPTLVVEAAGNVHGDCLLQCVVNDKVVQQYVLKGTGWTVCEFDLSDFVNKKPVIELWNTGGGAKPWFYEHGYIDKIYFK